MRAKYWRENVSWELLTVLKISNLTVEKWFLAGAGKVNLVPVHVCVSVLVKLRTWSLLVGEVLHCRVRVKSSTVQRQSLITQRLRWLKVGPHRQSLIGNTFAKMSSPGPSKYAISATDLCTAFVSADTADYQLKRGCRGCYVGSSKRSNSIREVVHFVPPGNVCSESHNNSMCFQRHFAGSVARCCEILKLLTLVINAAHYREREQKDRVSYPMQRLFSTGSRKQFACFIPMHTN
jgi:hypothetical protein